jgi:hypothetical protein
MALAGVAVLIGGYYFSQYLYQVNQEILNDCADYYRQTGAECANFVYYHDGGAGTLTFFLSLWVGGGLLFISAVTAIGYLVIRQ